MNVWRLALVEKMTALIIQLSNGILYKRLKKARIYHQPDDRKTLDKSVVFEYIEIF